VTSYNTFVVQYLVYVFTILFGYVIVSVSNILGKSILRSTALYVGNIMDCNDTSSIYLNNPNVERCPRSNWLAWILFYMYILMTAIMLINLLIAIFRYIFIFRHMLLWN